MKTLTKISALLVSVFCLSSCVGEAESKIIDERNIKWYSEDGKFHFTLEYDHVEDTSDLNKFWTGRGTIVTDSANISVFLDVNIARHKISILPLENAPDQYSGNLPAEDFKVQLQLDIFRDIMGLFISDNHVFKAFTEYDASDISYFDDFDQKLSWERLEDDEKNPLNYFMRTWINEDNGLSFTQDSPKLFIEQKLRGTFSDESPVLLAFGEEDFTLYRYDDAVEGDILLEGTYTKAVSSITLNVVTNNLYPENPGVIVLE